MKTTEFTKAETHRRDKEKLTKTEQTKKYKK
jgi:hypothetical protein